MHGLNTRVAKVQSTAMTNVPTAISSFLTGLDDNGSLSPETVSVLIFARGTRAGIATGADVDGPAERLHSSAIAMPRQMAARSSKLNLKCPAVPILEIDERDRNRRNRVDRELLRIGRGKSLRFRYRLKEH